MFGPPEEKLTYLYLFLSLANVYYLSYHNKWLPIGGGMHPMGTSNSASSSFLLFNFEMPPQKFFLHLKFLIYSLSLFAKPIYGP